jgi:hypothetical protein
MIEPPVWAATPATARLARKLRPMSFMLVDASSDHEEEEAEAVMRTGMR